jgi:hypothetical protein
VIDDESAISALEKSDTIGTRMTRIERICTDFLGIYAQNLSKTKQKSVQIRPNPCHPRSNRIALFQSGNCCSSLNHSSFILYPSSFIRKVTNLTNSLS